MIEVDLFLPVVRADANDVAFVAHHVDQGLQLLIKTPLMDVGDHAHDRQPVARIVQADAPAERLGRTARTAFAHDAFADDRDLRRVRGVLGGELAPGHEGNPHAREIGRASCRERV